MRLPDGDRATVRIEKLTEYALNPDHPVGKHKARRFAHLLGITQRNPEPLLEALRRAAEQAEATPAKFDEFGRRYTLDFPMSGPSGEVTVRSAWIVREDEPPYLVTCYII